MMRHETILRRDDTVLLVIDFQQKLVDVMNHGQTVTQDILRLIQVMNLLNVPILITEQYRKGLGPTVKSIVDSCPSVEIVEKMTFSCCGKEEFWNQLKHTNKKQVIVTGIETHVCVLQTVLDLLANGYQPHLPLTTTCSRSDENRDNALARMEKAGAILTNVESVIFELLVEAGTEEFKAARKFIV